MSDARSNSVVSTIGLNRKRPFRVAVCVVILAAFAVNTLAYDLAWAAPRVIARNPDEVGMTKQSKVEAITSYFTLPEYLGTIRDSWQSPQRTTDYELRLFIFKTPTATTPRRKG